MGGPICTVCAHPDKVEIDRLIIDGTSNRAIARQFNLSKDAVRRHKDSDIPKELLKAKDIKEYTTAERLACRLKDESDLVRELRDEARGNGDINTALRAVDRALKCIELCAKVQGLIQDQTINVNTQVNVLQDPTWIALRSKITKALEAYPEAKEAVVLAIQGQ